MADFLPDWWEGPEYLDVEDLFAQHFQKLLPNVRVCHWIQPDWYIPTGFVDATPTYGTEPTLRLWRQPGQRDDESTTDAPLLQFAAVTRSHGDSIQLIEFVHTVMRALNNGHKIKYNGQLVGIKNVGLWLGPQTIPEGPIDEFFVPVTYKFTVAGKKLQPNYRKILDSLND
ncbi:tail terminator [Mycobacterium phage Wildcat]|uniref:Tail terminator n=4 Tax=Mycobacterium virus Wildcat TaxID=1993859 RepID=Q19Y26_9CAUD|nr:tail terminator [Mycobacterium phage Wildcat]AJD82106.1 tail terminator [Mycobacterium phage Cosmo]AQT25706.1 tail terminator [Mycobacterium phage EniyanLRS]QGJ89924.1 tail terminator [Mycobacterium phage MaryV]WKR36044.1 tail terminator [Mycobacterium phage Azrael100]ABE67639.1 tail terminator [Mycobacterium phage Wildcat]